MEILKIFQMNEPVSKNLIKSQSNRSPIKHEQDIEITNLRQQLCSARQENFNLQKELSDFVREEATNKEKILELTKLIKELENLNEELKAPCSPRKVKGRARDIMQEQITSLEQQIVTLERKNHDLEDQLMKVKQNNDRNQENDDSTMIYRHRVENFDLQYEGSRTDIDEANTSLSRKSGDGHGDVSESEFQQVMLEYEQFFTKILQEREHLLHEKDTVQNHLANLEFAFNDLLEKYERAKKIVEGFKSNEIVLRRQIEDWSKLLSNFDRKYAELKFYAEKKISQANMEIISKDKGNIEELAKLKAKILQSQVKINELEKHVKAEDLTTLSVFEPLKNNLKKKHY